MWSAFEMYEHIKAEHRIDTIEHRGNIIWRIQILRLSSGASADQMNEHYEAFTSLISEAFSAGVNLEDWDKCERFLLSLDDDLEALRLQFRLMPSAERTWRNLVTIYKSLADTRRMRQQRDATVAAIFTKAFPKPSSVKAKGYKGGGDKERKEKGRGRGKVSMEKGAVKPKCFWCGIPGHQEGDCRKKAAGEPSKAHIQEAAKKLMEKKGSVNHVDANDWTAPTDVFGNVNLVSVSSPSPTRSSEFLVDSGASHHLVQDRSLLTNVQSIAPLTFGTAEAGADSLKATEKGTLPISVHGDTSPIEIHNVYHVPGVRMNILSVVNLRPIGWKFDFEAHAITFGSDRFPMTSTGLPRVRFTHFTPVRSLSPLGDAYAIRHVDSPLYNEHCRLGHLGRDALVDLAKGGKLKYDLDVIKADEFKLSDCTSCLAASSKRLPKSGESPEVPLTAKWCTSI